MVHLRRIVWKQCKSCATFKYSWYKKNLRKTYFSRFKPLTDDSNLFYLSSLFIFAQFYVGYLTQHLLFKYLSGLSIETAIKEDEFNV